MKSRAATALCNGSLSVNKGELWRTLSACCARTLPARPLVALISLADRGRRGPRNADGSVGAARKSAHATFYAPLLAFLFAAALHSQTPVILISVDTLRADHLNLYGYRTIQTPNMDSFAVHGTVFQNILSQIPLTLPSHTTLFTSNYPFETRVEENEQNLPASAITLASVLKGRGYQTGAFVGSVILDGRLGISRGFDFYDSPFHASTAAENPYSLRVRRDGALVIRAALQWLNEHRGQPAFAFVHLFDLHAPYSAAAGSSVEPEVNGYDAEIGYVDRLLGRFQQALRQSGWWDRSLVVLLSDHGESLGEHGESSHGYFIYRSTLWVPLIVHWPAAAPEPTARASVPGGLIDVAPTILDALHVPAPASFHGRSLLEPVQSADRHPAVYSESLYAHDAFRWSPLRSLEIGARHYIGAPKAELYDIAADPGERHNLLLSDTSLGADYQRQLIALLTRYRPPAPAGRAAPSSESRAVLGSLIYLGSGPGTLAGISGPDPKDRLPEYDEFERALGDLYAGRAPEAIAVFRQLLSRDERNMMARYYMGEACRRAGQFDDATREWTAVMQYDPEYLPAEEALGELWLARRDYAKARSVLNQALALAPDDYEVLFDLGRAEEGLGMRNDAITHLGAACAVATDPEPCRHELQALEGKQ